MTLQEKLDSFKADFSAGKPPYNVPAHSYAQMEKATQELIDSGAAEHALTVGDRAPEFTLNDCTGEPVSSTALLAQGPLIVSFYRGVWCPYCNLDLQALQAALPGYRELGANLVAVSPQTPVNSRRSVTQNKLSFPILSDAGNQGRCGVRSALHAARLPDRHLPGQPDRPGRVQPRRQRHPVDAGPFRDQSGRRDPLRRGQPRLHPAPRARGGPPGAAAVGAHEPVGLRTWGGLRKRSTGPRWRRSW